MITFRIKTFKDYKNQFIEWVKEPRRRVCKSYVSYSAEIAKRLIDRDLVAKCKELGLNEDATSQIVDLAEFCVSKAERETKELIDSCQPKNLL